MSSLQTLPKGDSAWLLRRAIERIIQQVSVLETNIGSSTTGNSANTQVIFNDNGVLRGDTGLTYDAANDILSFGAGTCYGNLVVGSNVLKVDSANNRVGIGTATPVNTLEVVAPAGDNIVSTFRSGDATAANNAGGGFRSISSATAANRVAQVWLDADGANFSGGDYFFIQKNGGSGTVEFNQSSNAAMVFLTNSTERYRIASDGVATWSNVGGVAGTAMTLNSTGLGVGVSPAYKGDFNGNIRSMKQGGRTDLAFLIDGNASPAWQQRNVLGHYYNGAQDCLSLRVPSSATTNTGSYDIGANGTHWWYSAAGTTATGSTGTPTMTLDASGNLLVNTTSQILSAKVSLQTAGTRGYSYNDTTGGAGTKAIIFGSLGVEVGSVSTTTLATTYNTLSDYRLKEAVQPLVGGLARVSALKPSIYKWKSNGSSGEGFIAHELADVVPAAVTGKKDAVNEDGTVNPQGVDMSRIVPILVAAIQELTARVQTLETR